MLWCCLCYTGKGERHPFHASSQPEKAGWQNSLQIWKCYCLLGAGRSICTAWLRVGAHVAVESEWNVLTLSTCTYDWSTTAFYLSCMFCYIGRKFSLHLFSKRYTDSMILFECSILVWYSLVFQPPSISRLHQTIIVVHALCDYLLYLWISNQQCTYVQGHACIMNANSGKIACLCTYVCTTTGKCMYAL